MLTDICTAIIGNLNCNGWHYCVVLYCTGTEESWAEGDYYDLFRGKKSEALSYGFSSVHACIDYRSLYFRLVSGCLHCSHGRVTFEHVIITPDVAFSS